MSQFWLFLLVVLIGIAGFYFGKKRSVELVDGDARKLHSRPNYHGMHVALTVLVPSLLVLGLSTLIVPWAVDRQVSQLIPAEVAGSAGELSLVMSDVRRVADGLGEAVDEGLLSEAETLTLLDDGRDVRALLGQVGVATGSGVGPEVLNGAQKYRVLSKLLGQVVFGAVLALTIGSFFWALMRIRPGFRARNVVETVIRSLLIMAAMIAILTTLGIVLSMLFETRNFFSQYPIKDYLFGITWAPDFRGDSQLGILPLLWGTLYISLIALIVAVPIGLFAAIYLSEYAGPKMRSVAKPLIEVLAGIPTIVYGLFALITVGPMLRDYLASPLGLGDSGASVMTAGLVMGIMLIPFVSSLSDDIINAVPQSLRDGSLGLGATQSETIRQVVVPAALPGIVGAVLLAASRAIGETMIVVLGAGAAAARLNQGLLEAINPFEAMTTVTVKIVSQLTGDTDFASPETLVAFALGLTLFILTLGLNVLALYIVRKYREQYE